MSYMIAGIDIGGTKCAISLGCLEEGKPDVSIVRKISFPTIADPGESLRRIDDSLEQIAREAGLEPGALKSIGISCGGPLDSRNGLILSPPNLPGWDRIDVVSPFRERYGVPVGVQNDANACAIAEWKWGAGRGTRHMVFLTFGTGMGAGLILNGQIYAGANDMAGEIGHMRMEKFGPVGFGKAGSFEGFCSGAGIAQLAGSMMTEHLLQGYTTLLGSTREQARAVTAEFVGEAARQGDELAIRIFRIVGCQLGKGLAILVDLLNPELIVIGSIYGRQRHLLDPIMRRTLEQEAIPGALSHCRIEPAGLGESVGDYAALSVALHLLEG